MTSVETGGHRAEEQPAEAGRPGGETEGTGEGRHSGHSPEAHPNAPAWVTVRRSPDKVASPAQSGDQHSPNRKQTEPW